MVDLKMLGRSLAESGLMGRSFAAMSEAEVRQDVYKRQVHRRLQPEIDRKVLCIPKRLPLGLDSVC